LTLAAIEMKL